MRGCIYFVERNVHGAWVIYGALGVRQYYYYTKKRAMELYRNECQDIIVQDKRTYAH